MTLLLLLLPVAMLLLLMVPAVRKGNRLLLVFGSLAYAASVFVRFYLDANTLYAASWKTLVSTAVAVSLAYAFVYIEITFDRAR